jgi:hypothetical protein
MVAGTRPALTPAQVLEFFVKFYQMGIDDVEARQFPPDDFLLVFQRRIDVDRVLHGEPPAGAPFRLSFMRWRSEARASVVPMLYKVLLDPVGIPVHPWDMDTTQKIVQSSSLVIQAAPTTLSMRGMRTFTVVTWCIDPILVSEQVVLVVPDKEAPYVEQGLFLRLKDLIHSTRGTTRYWVQVAIREVQDWRPHMDSSKDGDGHHGGPNGSDNDEDDSGPNFPGHNVASGHGRPMPRRHHYPDVRGRDPKDTWPTDRGGLGGGLVGPVGPPSSYLTKVSRRFRRLPWPTVGGGCPSSYGF